MSKREKRQISQLFALAVLSAALFAGLLIFKSTPVYAHQVPMPCDFTTGGGFVITDKTPTDGGNHANFGLVAGCKNGGFFGHVNFVDHDTTGMFAGLHVSSDSITAYVDPSPPSNYRDICGIADTNLPNYPTVYFRVRTLDKAEPGVGMDRFGIELAAYPSGSPEAVVISTRVLAGGNIQLHKPNPSTTGPNLTEAQITTLCGGMTGADMGF